MRCRTSLGAVSLGPAPSFGAAPSASSSLLRGCGNQCSAFPGRDTPERVTSRGAHDNKPSCPRHLVAWGSLPGCSPKGVEKLLPCEQLGGGGLTAREQEAGRCARYEARSSPQAIPRGPMGVLSAGRQRLGVEGVEPRVGPTEAQDKGFGSSSSCVFEDGRTGKGPPRPGEKRGCAKVPGPTEAPVSKPKVKGGWSLPQIMSFHRY